VKQINYTMVQRPALVFLRYLELLWVKRITAQFLAHVFLEIQLLSSSRTLCSRKIACEILPQWEGGTRILQ